MFLHQDQAIIRILNWTIFKIIRNSFQLSSNHLIHLVPDLWKKCKLTQFKDRKISLWWIKHKSLKHHFLMQIKFKIRILKQFCQFTICKWWKALRLKQDFWWKSFKMMMKNKIMLLKNLKSFMGAHIKPLN